VAEKLAQITHDVVLDGEVVALNSRGKPEFQLLQNYKTTGKGTLAYYVFDLLELNGYDIKDLELLQRRELLDELFASGGKAFKTEQKVQAGLFKTYYVRTDGKKYFYKSRKDKVESVIDKLAHSLYRPGRRSDQWLKFKTQ